MHAVAETQQDKDRRTWGRPGRLPLLVALGLATLYPAGGRGGPDLPIPDGGASAGRPRQREHVSPERV
jgi:hypothetical protein